MDKSSSVNTGVVTGTATGLYAVLDWTLNTKCGIAAPPAVLVFLSGAALTFGHLICNLVNAKYGKQLTAIETPQGATNETITSI